MKLTLIRHAESTYNEKKLLQGQIDCELSKKGLEDTKEKSKNFPSDFDICFCSPLASRFILKEKISWKKYLMILGIFICVLILALIK